MAAQYFVWRAGPTGIDSGGVEAPPPRTLPGPSTVQPMTTPLSSSSSSSSSSTPTPPYWHDTAAAMWQRYYHDPARYRPPTASPLSPSTPLPGPPLPPTYSTASLHATNAMLELVSASLKALQAQFTTFQESLGDVKSDVKDVLLQIHALRTAQSKTDKSIAELESVIGVSQAGTEIRKTSTAAETPLEVDTADQGAAPEKTLIQSVASIQFAIDALLVHSHLPATHREPTLPLSVNHPAGQTSSSLSSVVDPSRQRPTLQLMPFAFPVLSTSQSRSSTPISSVAIHTPDFPASLPSAVPGKEYTDVSIQACTSSSTSEPSSSLWDSHGHTPRFIPMDWNVDLTTLGRFANDSSRQTASTPDFLRESHPSSASPTASAGQAPLSDQDHQPRSSTTSDVHSPTRMTSAPALSSYLKEPNTKSQRADRAILPTAFNSSDTHSPEPIDFAAPSQTWPVSDLQMSSSPSSSLSSTPDAQASPPPQNVSVQSLERLQVSSLATRDLNSSMTRLQTGLPCASKTSFTSPLSALTSTRDTPMSASDAPWSEVRLRRPHAESNTEGNEITLDTEGNTISAAGVAETVPGATTTAPSDQQISSGEADNGGLQSGLPMLPLETVMDDCESQPVSFTMRERGEVMDPRLILPKHLRNFPVIPTPPSLTPEPSAGEDQGISAAISGRGPLEAVSELPSPLTPPPFSPPSAAGNSLAEESGQTWQTAVHGATQGRTNSPDNGERVVVQHGDHAVVWVIEESTSARSAVAPANESQSIAVSNEDVSQLPNTDFFRTSESSASQPSPELPEHNPAVVINGVDPAYFYSSANGYGSGCDSHFSSPLRNASRYVTPSESSDVRPMQDEEEVWHALVLGESGVSTPLSSATSLPRMFSCESSRTSSVCPPSFAKAQSPSVHPSVLQLRNHPPLLRPLPAPQRTHSSRFSDVSLSSLTSLEDTDVEKESDHTADASAHEDAASKAPGPRDPAPAGAPEPGPRSATFGASHEYCYSEPYRGPSLATLPALGVPGRAASENTGMQQHVGGPSASLEELTVLARRPGARIRLKVPEGKRGLKRKRSVDADGGEDGRLSRRGNGMHMDREARVGQANGDVPPARIEAEVSAPGTRSPTLTVSRLAPESSTRSALVDSPREHPHMMSDLATSHSATKKESDRRHKRRKRVPKATAMLNVTYHVRNGQIVALVAEPEPRSQAPVVTTASQSEEAGPVPVSNRRRQENRVMKTPLSSPGYAKQPSSRGARFIKSSPAKEDAWNTISGRVGIWPELPSALSHWDAQFIQCDKCERWYHYGCVAIETGDPRLEPAALFACPPCRGHNVQRQKHRNQSESCGRPDCPEPQMTAESELYFVEKLVGRKRIEGYVYMWLAKWEGYPITEATWIPKENVVGGDTRLFDTFLENAAEQGADLSRDVVLLQEALDAGWDA